MKLSDLFHFSKKKEPNAQGGAPEPPPQDAVPSASASETADLLIRTRSGSDPYGKPKIFFTCHPADFSLYFEEIAGDILDLQNCVLCYRDPNRPYTREDMRQLLTGGVSLVVIPITARLLSEPNDAVDMDFPLAVESHIPVLPLVQQSGLDEAYARRFGSLHYLFKGSRDLTAISFSDKLRQYLESVLIGDAEKERIRKAFDAYIFLSYRKKDREAAQALMRLIHQNETFRDVAIWYDEYLVPGESFSDAIVRMLRKCDLFLLAVTPNLVKEDNYVRQEEFPFAIRSGLKIVAAEILALSEQQKTQLPVDFPGIPGCVYPDPPESLFSALAENLQKMLLQDTPHDRVHTFCIGLAYLKGVDVEVDSKRAAELITRAAEQNLPEAMRKLAAMYTTGDGVARDFAAAAAWMEKLAAQAEESYRKNPDSENGQALYRCLRDLETAYQNAARRKDAISACERAIALANASRNTAWGAEQKARAQMDRGLYEYEETRIDAADRWYAMAESGLKAPFDIAVLCERRSLTAKRLGDLDKAEQYLSKAMRIRDQLSSPHTGLSVRRSQAVSHLQMGDIVRGSGRLEEAHAHYVQALDLYTALAGETRGATDRDGMEVCFCALAEISGDPAEKQRYYQKAMDILTPLVEETGSRELLVKKSIVEFNLTGKISAMEKAADLQEEGDPVQRHEKFVQEAEDAEAAADWPQAADRWQKAHGLMRKILSDRGATPTNCCILFHDGLHACIALQNDGQPEKARALLHGMLPEIRDMERKFGAAFTESDGPLAHSRNMRAEVCLRLALLSGDSPEAASLLDEGLEAQRALYQKSGQADDLYALARACLTAAGACAEDRDIYLDEALRFCAQGTQLFPGDARFETLKQKTNGLL